MNLSTTRPETVPYGYCHCGCGERTAAHDKTRVAVGIRAGEPRRFLPHHHRRTGANLNRYAVDDRTGCWNWEGAIDPAGYAHVTFSPQEAERYGSKGMGAYRAMYIRTNGPIAPGLQIDHLCRNRRCVNPAHLEAVTAAENQRRAMEAKRMADLFTVPEAAGFMRMSEPFVYDHWRELGGVKNGRSVRIPKAGILAYWQRQVAAREKDSAREREADRARNRHGSATDDNVVQIIRAGSRA